MATNWHNLDWFKICSSGDAICIVCKVGHQLAQLALVGHQAASLALPQTNRVEHGFMTSECCKALTAAPSSKSRLQIYSSTSCPQQQIPILVSPQDQSFFPTRDMKPEFTFIFRPELFQMLWWPKCPGMGSIQIDHHCTKEAQSSIRFKIQFSINSPRWSSSSPSNMATKL